MRVTIVVEVEGEALRHAVQVDGELTSPVSLADVRRAFLVALDEADGTLSVQVKRLLAKEPGPRGEWARHALLCHRCDMAGSMQQGRTPYLEPQRFCPEGWKALRSTFEADGVVFREVFVPIGVARR